MEKTQAKVITLSPKQQTTIDESDAAYNVWVGAVSSGKTLASTIRLLQLMRDGPAGDVMIIGVSREAVQRNVIKGMCRLANWPEPSSKTTHTKLYNRDVYFIGAHDESAVRTIQGSTLALAYVDEATCLPNPFWRMLESRLRVPGARLLATCNPEGPQHWLKKDFIDRASDLGLKYWNFTLDDNPSLTDEYKNRIKASYSGMWYKRYILGEWAVAHGLIYDGYDHDNLFEHPLDTPNFYIMGIDYGTSNATAAVLLAVSPKRWPQIRVEAEYYYDSAKRGRSKTDSELVSDIREFIGWRSIRTIYVDPSAASLKLELRSRDLPVIDAKNDVLAGIKITSKFISNKNIVIHKSCKTVIETLQSYCWDPKAADRGEDKPLKEREHILDALRYAVFSAFPSGEISHPDENLTIEEIRRNVYGTDDLLGFHQGTGGYV